MKIKEIPDPQTVYKGSQCQHQYTQKVSTGCRLQAAGYRRQAASYRQQAAGEEQQQARGYKQQATSYRLSYRLQASCFGVDPKIISVCWRAFRKQ